MTIPELEEINNTGFVQNLDPPIQQAPRPRPVRNRRFKITTRTFCAVLIIGIAIALQLMVAGLNLAFAIETIPVSEKSKQSSPQSFPPNSSYLFSSIDLSKYSEIEFSFNQTTEGPRNIIRIAVTLNDDGIRGGKGEWYNLSSEIQLEENNEGVNLSLVVRHWPSTQPDPVGTFACQNNDPEEKVFVVWKWSEIQTVQDNGSYAFECYKNTIEYPKCNESTPINVTHILQDRQSNQSVVSIRLCAYHDTEVRYETHFYEHRYVPEGRYNQYILESNSTDAVTVPLDKEIVHLILTVESSGNESKPVKLDINLTLSDETIQGLHKKLKSKPVVLDYGDLATGLLSLIAVLLILIVQCIKHCNNR